MAKITPYKGGRSARVYARITPEAKVALLARVDREGFGSFADWLEYQAMPHLTQRGADYFTTGVVLPAVANQSEGESPA